ncbi:ATP-binding protein [Parachitinimonas caeni]|uniref:histidine kinase n=1 Tax=Parachitinimonas caeni TaxID=3031301 RepID=A0ABT7DRH3_9NEIS|nr:ATP-binding protein [Parachitinimonas caeni]MDK2122579.1 ATP-binding protein [Parachitinimonas caeni]
MASRIAIVIVIGSVLAGWFQYQGLQKTTLEGLRDYVEVRSKADSEHFLLAETQTRMLADEFLRRYRLAKQTNPDAEFDRVFSRYPDGLIRVRPELNDFRHRATVFVRHDVPLTDDLKRRLLVGYHLLSEWGPLSTNRFLDSFMNMPEQLSLNYAPFVDWSNSATRDTDIYSYETVWRSTREKNPKRLPFWTGVYFDDGARKWMVSHVTPVDDDGRWIASPGEDIVIDDLVGRTTNEHLAGTYNLIVRRDGQLIAHPELTRQIQSAGGVLDIARLQNPELASIVSAARRTEGMPSVVESDDGRFWLGVGRLRGPDWLLITVYPKHLLLGLARESATIVLALGALSLLIELLVLRAVLRAQVATPLAALQQAVSQIRAGQYEIRLDQLGQDEIGHFGKAFSELAQALRARDAALQTEVLQRQREAANAQQLAARLSALSEAIPDPVLVVAADGHVLEVFGHWLALWDESPQGCNLRDLLPASQAQLAIQSVADCLSSGKPARVEYRQELDGDLRQFEGVSIPLPKQFSEESAVLWLVRDVTELKRAEGAIRQARDHLEEVVRSQTADLLAAKERADAANQSKTTFVSNISHELRTPMHAILSFARLGAGKVDQGDADKLKRYFLNIAESGERMLTLVNDLLDITKLEAGKMAYRFERNRLRQVTEVVLDELAELAAKRQLKITVAQATVDDIAQFDALRIGQVIRNLLSNAIKFSPEGGLITVTIGEHDTDTLSLSVADQGQGIPEAECELIFDKFMQSSQTPGLGGTGLGLAICREIVRHHGGDIEAKNLAVGGAVFSFRIPRMPPQTAGNGSVLEPLTG